MLVAFVLATFGPWSVLQFVFSHVLGFSALGLVLAVVAAIAVAVLVPGGLALVRTALGAVAQLAQWLIGTTAGRVILIGAVCLVAGWSARAALDSSIDLRRRLEAQSKATVAATEAAAQARLQAAMLRDVGAEAARRAEAAEAESQDLQTQVDDFVDQLDAPVAAAATGGKPPRACCALSAADIAALTRIGAPHAPKTR